MHKLQIVESQAAVPAVSCKPPCSCSPCSGAGRQCQRRDSLLIWPRITIFLYYKDVGMKINVCLKNYILKKEGGIFYWSLK